MSLADIKAKISAEAKTQIAAIESENDAKVRAVNDKVNAEVKEIQDTYAARLAKEEPEVLRRREIVAELDAKRVDLGVRQRLVGEAFAASVRQMADLPHDKYLGFVWRLMNEAVSSGVKSAKVLVGKNEKHIDQDWLNNFNGQHGTELTLEAERLPISGGFVLRDDRIDTNCSWEMLIADARTDLEPGVVKKLFAASK